MLPHNSDLSDLLYVSENKIYRRLGLRPNKVHGEIKGSVSVVPGIEASGARSWDRNDREASHRLVMKAKSRIEEKGCRDFTDPEHRTNHLIRLELDMVHKDVHEDSGTPPEDVALFVGTVPAARAGQSRDLGVLLCGSVEHLRAREFPRGRMGSDTTWLHDLVKKVEEREDSGFSVIPEFITDVLDQNPGQNRIESAAYGVHNWVCRESPKSYWGPMAGHAIVLMDIDKPEFPMRLLVASPFYVQSVQEAPDRPGRLRRVGRRIMRGRELR